MRQWVLRLLEQLDIEWEAKGGRPASAGISEERATLLFLIDTIHKHLIDVEQHPVRRVREALDEFAKSVATSSDEGLERTLFRFRQFYSAYRVDEVTFVHKTFEEFKGIIWDFADQLSDEIRFESAKDHQIRQRLEQLREAVEANAIDQLVNHSRAFIDTFTEIQSERDESRSRRMVSLRKNLDDAKKQLDRANASLRKDHLSGLENRRAFDEELRNQVTLAALSQQPVTLIILDIDHFKKVNDTYGHDVGDRVIVQAAQLLVQTFTQDQVTTARIGGEEFAVILPGVNADAAVDIAERALARIRETVLHENGHEIRFTMSMGIAELCQNETPDHWQRRADSALYQSKNSGRNRYTVAADAPNLNRAA